MEKKNIEKYFKYAIGEIVLVVIGNFNCFFYQNLEHRAKPNKK